MTDKINPNMKEAPRTGLLLLFLKSGQTIVGRFSAQQGWVADADMTGKHIPIQTIAGWAPYTGPLPAAETPARKTTGASRIVGGQKALEAAQAAVAARQAKIPAVKETSAKLLDAFYRALYEHQMGALPKFNEVAGALDLDHSAILLRAEQLAGLTPCSTTK